MAELLLELCCEEIPARMQPTAIKQLVQLVSAGLQAARLSFDGVVPYVTPRRMALYVQGLPDVQPDQHLEKKGPKLSAPDKAIDGFCASVGLTREQLVVRSVGKDEVYFAVSTQKGKPTIEALSEVIEPILKSFHWQKSMRWGKFSGQWVRPMRSIVCLLDDKIVPIRWHHIAAGNTTIGHRFMSDGVVTIPSPEAYARLLERNCVYADSAARKAEIWRQAEALATAKGLAVKKDDALLDEVTGLVEWPVALMGTFDPQYLRLPPEVLVLEMRHHQKYFAILDKDGGVTNHFIAIANLEATDGGDSIVAGNERVLKARLEDGAFYYEQDQRKSLEAWNDGLATMVFHKKLGSVQDKVNRIVPLAGTLAVFIPRANLTDVARAATLCKADLVTGMVGEFPELQGVMGRYYALDQGETQEVADAIRDHYKPVGRADDVPQQPVSLAVSLADKLDSLCGLFAADEVPTGSKDPFALRRAALGIIRMIREHQLRLPLSLVLPKAAAKFKKLKDPKLVTEQVSLFLHERLAVVLKEEGLRYDVIEAIAADAKEDDLERFVKRCEALQTFLDTSEGENVMAACKRASNILKKQEHGGRSFTGSYKASHCEKEEETALVTAMKRVTPKVNQLLDQESYKDAMEQLVILRTPLDAFFERVTVNTEDEVLRRNRLEILAGVRAILHRVADFSKIEG